MLEPREAIDRISAVYRGPHPGSRALHAKGSFHTGTFTATAEAAALCRAAPFRGDPVPVLVRWSNASGHPRSRDTSQDVRGMAVSFRPDLATAAGAIDLLGQTAPRFPVRTPEAFVAFTEAAAKPATLPLFLARHPAAGVALLANARARSTAPPRSYAEATYFPIHAYGWTSPDGDRSWVRYTLAPLGGAADRPEGTYEGRDRLPRRSGPGWPRAGALRPPGHRGRARRRPRRPDVGVEGRPGAQRRRRRGDRRGPRPARPTATSSSSTRPAWSTGSRCPTTRSCATARRPTPSRPPEGRRPT